MNAQTSRKIIVASGMAVVVAIGVVIFALRSHSVTSAAQTPHPPTPIAETPEIPTPPPAVAQIPDAPAPVAASDSVASNSADSANPPAVEPKPAHNRHLAEASTSAIATNDTVTRTGSAADTSGKPATPTVADSADSAKSADERTTPQPISGSPADEQNVGASTAFAASDSQITIDVKSEIAGDGLSKDVNIGVTTTQGVVALTGSLASQDAIDHVKDVAGKVAGVKSVDTSALILASL